MRYVRLVIVLFVGTAAVPFTSCAQTPSLPLPAGPFGIGRVGYDWTDDSRQEDESADPKGRRELMVYFWYPAAKKSVETRGAYIPGAQQIDKMPEAQTRMNRQFGANWPLILSGAVYSHAAERAPAATSPRQFPAVIFSHGAGSTGFNYTCLIEDLVSRGYVVASIEHTYAAKAVWFPDGRIIPLHDGAPPPGSPAERAKLAGREMSMGVNYGAADVRFVLDQLTKLNGNPREFLLAGRIDLQHVAAMGHSAGAEFAARACQLDARFRACVDLDGGMVPEAALPLYSDDPTMKQPLLFLEAYHPHSQMGGLSEARIAEYEKTREEQLKSCPRGTYAVVLNSPGIAHPSFSDLPLLSPGQKDYPTNEVSSHNLLLIERFIREFLDKTLKQEKAPLLENGRTPIPEATVDPYGK
jgi:dienelactone hydrolase